MLVKAALSKRYNSYVSLQHFEDGGRANFKYKLTMYIKPNKAGNVRINVTLIRIRLNIVVVEKHEYYVFVMYVCIHR